MRIPFPLRCPPGGGLDRADIPPSIPLLIYGVMANVSVGKLFIGGFIPGILMGVGLMIYSYIVGKKRNYKGRETRASLKEILNAGKSALLALFMPVIIIGGIMSGKFTATESGAIAVFYALIVGIFIYRELKFKSIISALVNCAKSTGQVLIVVAFASLFTWIITVNQVPQAISAMMASAIHSKVILLLVINVILLIAGTFIDTTSALVLFTPAFLAAGADVQHRSDSLRPDYGGQPDHRHVHPSAGRLSFCRRFDRKGFPQGADA